MEEGGGRLPLLTLKEFFRGNTEKDSIAPNRLGFGRPALAEIWGRLQEVETMPGIAWIRVALHDDSVITEYKGRKAWHLLGEQIIVCTSLSGQELEKLADCEWLCSDGAEEWQPARLDALFSRRPAVPAGFSCFGIEWDQKKAGKGSAFPGFTCSLQKNDNKLAAYLPVPA